MGSGQRAFRKKRKIWLPVILLIVIVGLGYAAYTAFVHTGADYLTISEMKSQAETLEGHQFRVRGTIAPGSINWDEETKVIRFVLTDEKDSLNISYQGIVPDNFKPGVDVTIEGKYQSDGVFEAVSFGSRGAFCNSCH